MYKNFIFKKNKLSILNSNFGSRSAIFLPTELNYYWFFNLDFFELSD
jgi:hypothetical protein